MDVAVRAEEITSHIVNQSVKRQAKENLTKYLVVLEDIPKDDEVSVEPEEDESYRDDGTDGVSLTTVKELRKRETERMIQLRGLHEGMSLRETRAAKKKASTVLEPVSINAQDKRGYTKVHRAVFAANYEEVVDLIKRGARIDIKDRAGMTALDRAKFRADISVVAGRISAYLGSL